MRVYSYVLAALIFLAIAIDAVADSNGKPFAVLNVIDNSSNMGNGRIEVDVFQDGINSRYSMDRNTIYADLDHKRTQILIPLSTAINYVRINYYEGKERYFLDVGNNLFLFQNKDSVTLHITSKGVHFDGKVADKFNFMHENYTIESLDLNLYHEKIKRGEYEHALVLKRRLIDSVFNIRMERLDAIEASIDHTVRDMIFMDLVGKHEQSLAGSYRSLLRYFKYDSVIVRLANKGLKQYFSREFVNSYPNEIAASSFHFPDFLLNIAIEYIKLGKHGDARDSDKQAISDVSAFLIEHYDATLRDRLISELFYFTGQRFKVTDSDIELALEVVESTKYSSALHRFISRNYGGKAFPFELKDMSGKTVRLDDFKGKLLVIDFWFTGCLGCITLTKGLTPVIEGYKDNPNIVFLSVSVDKNSATWLKSASEGRYTPSNARHLYTDEMAMNHPIIKYYNIISYPTLVVISKTGYTITTSPPRPNSTDTAKTAEFKHFLNSYL